MEFRQIAHQRFESTDGSVQAYFVSDIRVEYFEPRVGRRAWVGFDLRAPPRMRLFRNEITGWIVGDFATTEPMSDGDRSMVLDRLATAFRTDGTDVQIVPE